MLVFEVVVLSYDFAFGSIPSKRRKIKSGRNSPWRGAVTDRWSGGAPVVTTRKRHKSGDRLQTAGADGRHQLVSMA